MTKVLEVFGDADYSVISFEDAVSSGKVDKLELFEKALKEGKSRTFEDDDTYFEYQAHEFGAIDPAFIEFIHNDIEDYDMAKHHTFFVLEDK